MLCLQCIADCEYKLCLQCIADYDYMIFYSV